LTRSWAEYTVDLGMEGEGGKRDEG
jgi:hypothetical protein